MARAFRAHRDHDAGLSGAVPIDPDQGSPAAARRCWMVSTEPAMPESAVPFIVALCAAFSIFVLVAEAVSVWSRVPDCNARD